MLQVYLLSVLANLIGGSVLAGKFLGEKIPALSFLSGLSENRGAKITLGIITAVVGVLGFIFRAPTETVPIAGDLLPSLIALGVGGMLLLDTAKTTQVQDDTESEETEVEIATDLQTKLMPYRVPMGIAGIVAGLVHFVMPSVLLL